MTSAGQSIPKLIVLGGGPAGLAAAYYAKKSNMPVRVLEAAPAPGGNARTIRWGAFGFDTGAHRLHDRNPASTAVFREMLGDDLLRVEVPSQIFHNGTFIDFPLSPLDVFRKLPLIELLRIAAENVFKALRSKAPVRNFAELAMGAYGATLAHAFLLNYSRKLWGEEPAKLSPAVAGKRLKGLDLTTFLLELLRGARAKTAHLDGGFYYPRKGIGQLFDNLADTVGRPNIRTQARITRLIHNGSRITGVLVNDSEPLPVGNEVLVNSLPLSLVVKLLDPTPPDEIIRLARSLRFRHLVLGVVALNKKRFSDNASLYFPGPEQPFTRIYEPANRSHWLAPPDKTCIVVEIPCFSGDQFLNLTEYDLRKQILYRLQELGLLEESEVQDFRKEVVSNAYPVLDLEFERTSTRLIEYLNRFENMHLLGRSALFRYVHIHDIFQMARDKVEVIKAGIGNHAGEPF